MKLKSLLTLVGCLFLIAGVSVTTILSQNGTLDDEETATEVSLEEPKDEAIDLTLTVPNAVTNGEVFQVSVSYDPPISGSWQENFIFLWGSKVEDFDETTIRVKKFEDYGNVSASFEAVVAPIALNIEGKTIVIVNVPGVGNAYATMTVNN
ncbi:hypothetical protein H8E77_18020 [bacterium]|nr:hypothetical protein [bacterium]